MTNLSSVKNVKPNLTNINLSRNFTYLETRTINKGQPVPWGLNWLITYPISLTFTGQRS